MVIDLKYRSKNIQSNNQAPTLYRDTSIPHPQSYNHLGFISCNCIIKLVITTVFVLVGVMIYLTLYRTQNENESVAISYLNDIGVGIRRQIDMVIEPALIRTRQFAKDPILLQSLETNNMANLMATANKLIQQTKEVDAITIFGKDGVLIAINTVDNMGQEYANQSAINNLLGISARPNTSVQNCLNNEDLTEQIEFQLNCRITPALFGSTGLAVSISVPVTDPTTNQRIGVVSTRLRFERLNDLIMAKQFLKDGNSVYYITDDGQYFSESIARGQSAMPIPTNTLQEIVKPLVSSEASDLLAKDGDQYLNIFSLKRNDTTRRNMHIMLVAKSMWLDKEKYRVELLNFVITITLLLLFCLVMMQFWHRAKQNKARFALVNARNAAEAASEAKSEFLANMSHEIRTPMTAILGYSDSLNEPNLPKDKLKEAVHVIHRNGEHLLRIINDILDLSKIEAGKMNIDAESCSPMRLLAEVASVMRPRAIEKNLKLTVTFDTPVPERIVSDPTRIRQILLNLVGNAIKFTNEGAVTIHCRFMTGDVQNAASRLIFEVQDTGVGIAPEQQEKIFHPFSQVDSSMTRRAGGTGLGLTISKRLCELLGGRLSLHSQIGKGSRFTVTIPLSGNRTYRLVDQPSIVHTPDSHQEDLQKTDEKLKNANILFAEDAPDNRKLITYFLENAGAHVVSVENGKLALEEIQKHQKQHNLFDLVIMDMQMPTMDGFTATREIRELGLEIPVLGLTAHALPADRKKCLEAGCDDYATKPIHREQLIQIAQKMIEMGKSRNGNR